ncbi:MAG: IS1182 family transposase [Cyanobacteria bacterium P01_D01_bin.36]
MCLHEQPIKAVPTETARIARAAFPKGNVYLTLRDELGSLFVDSDFAELYASVGQPTLPPWQLALVTIMQFRENLSDRQAADAVRSRIDWKYLLGLELTDQGFDHSVLSEFRKRLIAGESEHLLLDKLLQRCQKEGIVKARGQQRTDATRVLADVRKLNRLELVGETMRAALNELATIFPDWLSEIAPEAWYDRYGHRVEDYRLPKTARKRDAYGLQVGKDAYYLLSCLETSALENWQELAQIKALKITLERHYEYNPDAPEKQRVRWKSKKELPRAEAGIESPYDTDARFRSRRGVNWVGYAVHFSETCDDGECHLITHVDTTDATIHEAQRTELIHQSLANKNLLPSEHFVDSAYVSAEHLVNAEQQQIELMGPARANLSWQSRRRAGIDETQFDINWETKTVTCPKGKRSTSWKRIVRSDDDRPRIRAMFSSHDCSACEYKVLCTKSAQRSVSFLPQAQHEALVERRSRQANPYWKKRYQRRAGIEGTLSQGVRGFGLRRSRYKGLAKTHLQNMAIAAAINIDRLDNWFNGVAIAKTRRSRFKRLKKV